MQLNNSGSVSVYSKQILNELREEGTVELFRIIRAGEYDETRAKFTTYLYPFLKGVMWRWMESNLGVLSLDARDMEILRTVQKEYYAAGLDESEIMSAHGISSLEIQRYLSYNTHFLSVYDLIPEDVYTHGEPFDPYEYLNPHLSENAVSWTVYHKICLELLKELFLSLSERDRNILGASSGLFGMKRKSLTEIAKEELLTVDGVIKARKSIVRKLKKTYIGSKLQRWRRIYHEVKYTCL